MPIMPPAAQQQPSYPSDREALWKAVRALEQRLERPAPDPQAKTGVVTTSRPTVRVLGASVDRDVWRVNSGAALEVGDEVVCVETALGLVVLSVVQVPPLGPYVPPSAPVSGNLLDHPIPALTWATYTPSYVSAAQSGWSMLPAEPTAASSDANYKNAYIRPTGIVDVTPFGMYVVTTTGYRAAHPFSAEYPNAAAFRVFPLTPIGTAGQSFVQLPAATSYSFTAWVLQYGSVTPQGLRHGVTWYDSAFAEISSDFSPITTLAANNAALPDIKVQWAEYDPYSDPIGAYSAPVSQLSPLVGTFAAPAGATHARCFAEFISAGTACVAAHFDFRVAP